MDFQNNFKGRKFKSTSDNASSLLKNLKRKKFQNHKKEMTVESTSLKILTEESTKITKK